MAGELVYNKHSGKINEVIIGEGAGAVKVGGQECLPFLFKEGKIPNRPLIAFEVWDSPPLDWPQELANAYPKLLNDTVEWAKVCQDKYQADLICLKLKGAHPDFGDRTAQQERELVAKLLKSINVPLIITGCDDDEKDSQVLSACCEEARGKHCLVGEVTQDNYRTLTAAALADGHSIIAQSPIDINIAKQLNILISDMGLPSEKIVMNPTIGPLGYGLEYAYSIMERARLAALSGDKMMAMPFICFVGQETWRVKEAQASEKEFPQWGPEKDRGIIWEATTAAALVQAGADILVMSHPQAASYLRKHIDELYSTQG